MRPLPKCLLAVVVALALVVTLDAALLDDFNRANGGLGANWTNLTGAAMQVVSNKAAPGTFSEFEAEVYSGCTWAANQSAQIIIGASNYSWALVRMSGTGATTSGYGAQASPGTGIYLKKIDALGETTIDSIFTGAPTAGQTVTLAVSGTGASIALNVSVQGSLVGSSPYSRNEGDPKYDAGKAGIGFYDAVNTGTTTIDDFDTTGHSGCSAAPTGGPGLMLRGVSGFFYLPALHAGSAG